MKNLVWLVGVLGILLCACSNSEGVGSSPRQDAVFTEGTLPGMVNVAATGRQTRLGTNEGNARVNERPQMNVSFDYDFLIDRHEVTCADFNALMKNETGLSLDCEDNALPATNLTYYDAVLFSNAKSRSEKRDSVYTYVKANFDAERHCTNLEGFAYHPDVGGYRLPTEAEWVFVAEQDWNPSGGWNADNSDYRLHGVCMMSGSEVCDMAGNAMEWVNDWLGEFRDTTISNYVGAPDGGALGQRIVKGGSYRNAASSISLYGRGDVYTVTSSTRADYVGFRLAFGKVPNAVWMSSNGGAVTSRVVPITGAVEIHSLTGTYKVKLAFRNDLTGNIAFIDYFDGNLSVIEIQDTIDSYHPEISPDGKRIAFCTGLEGVSGTSALYVRDLNAAGTNLVKLDVKSAAIPRWRVLENGDTAIVYVTSSGNNKEESAFHTASTWQVKFANGKFGKPEKLFDGAYHGGVSEDGRLAVTGARLLRARVSNRDTLWYNGEQACNVSLAKDSSKRTLFLDFGGETGREFVGEKYGTHERLLIADSTGKLIRSVAAPAGYSFDHSEWTSGGTNLIAATLTSANGVHEKVVLVNLADSSIVELVQGDELWHPNVWINRVKSASDDVLINLDSAGIYLSENVDLEQMRFRVKMELYWRTLEQANVLLVGSSRMELGMDPDAFPKWNMLNFAVQGIDPNRDFYFVENYMLNHPQHLKAIAISLDIDCWRGLEDHLALIMNAGVGYTYDALHGFWKEGVPNGMLAAVENSFPAMEEVRSEFSERGGFLTVASRSWDADKVEILHDSVFSEKEMSVLKSAVERLNLIVQRAAENNIYIIGIIFPQAPQYKKTGAMGVYGLQRSVARQVISSLDSLDKANKYFVLMDENKMGNHDYTDEMAYNRDHLSRLGSLQMASRLDSVLKTLKW